ncbi:branched-chain amino acid aminotransferase [Tistlia consotensis]|uniref:Probable branched-chain-amino-acid aminotransferase n=1 Tax=Tistlia consotensis USBA 355 TaxID=560819 RepID=A0A1Y6BRC8_9PROT|nr:aminotransferase class IV [Tistlia consotensis]SMF16973.1 branched-chain amino acid aminotransferase [Tistlia consotensis USBA 355]SNR40772.1 branched-chain amino acid aminotransferase [Tistlia consotensis]
MDSSQDFSPEAFLGGAAFIDGRFVPIGEAKISVLDRGLSRSDATYDVTNVWKGWIFRLDDHLERFERNMAALRLKAPYARERIREILIECVRLSGLQDSFLQMTCTRGLTPKGSRDPRTAVNTFYAFAVPFVWIADPEQQKTGLNLHISSIERISPKSVDPRTKNFHWIDLTLGLFEAYDAGCDLEVLIDGAGNITEGPGFNVFVRKGGRLVTPDAGVFDGMTRRTVIELCAETNIAVTAEAVPVEAVRGADEIFITSTAGGVMPVTRLDGIPVGDGTPGPLTRRLKDLYWSKKEAGWLGTPVDYGA